MKSHLSFSPPRSNRGFTLVEILISMTIMGLASVGIFKLLIYGQSIYYYDAGRVKVNEDIRSFTGEMTTNAVYSNYGRILPNFTTRSSGSQNAFVADGQSGDFLLLVFCDTESDGKTKVNRLIGYYRTPSNTSDPASTGPVRKFDKVISPSIDPAATPIYDILNTYVPTSTANTNPVVLQLAQGLSNGNLFYNFKDRSVIIRGQIVEQGNLRRRAVNTYNFTVSPRG
jgi:prepilin-type N-terminal cleavage/methylation domain-containing protein